MSAPLPSPFLSPVFSPFSPSPDFNPHELHSEHHDSHSPHRKRDRVRSFVKHLASPFASPSPSPAHLPSETGSPIISLRPELEPGPSILRKRESANSIRSFMKNPPSPSSSASSTPFPSPDVSRLSPNPNHSNPEIDPSGSPIRKRERVRSFVKSIRRTSSQLFKKDRKDGESKKSTSAISTLVSDSLSVSTAATAPHILRRLSHSKQPSMTSMTSATTTESDLSTGYLEVKVEGSISSPIIEVDTPVSPTVVQPLDTIPMSSLKEEVVSPGTEPEGTQSFLSLNEPSLPEAGSHPTETALEGPDPLQFPLPPSPALSPSPMDPFDSIQTPVWEPEVEATTGGGLAPHDKVAPHDDNSSPQHESEDSSPSELVQPPAPTDITSIIPPPYQTSQPPSTPPSPSVTALGPDREKEDQEMRDLCIPVLIPPMLFWPISNMRLTYFFTPVLTWWLSKGVLSYPYLYS